MSNTFYTIKCSCKDHPIIGQVQYGSTRLWCRKCRTFTDIKVVRADKELREAPLDDHESQNTVLLTQDQRV